MLGKLKKYRRTSIVALVWVVIGAVGFLAYTRGYLDTIDPASWSPVQWIGIGVNALGFFTIWLSLRLWGARQDQVWEEVDLLRSQIDSLREALYTAKTQGLDHRRPEPVEGDLPTIDAIPSARPNVPEPPPEEAHTEMFRAIRAVPTGTNEPATVERDLGGRTFTFRG